MRQMMKCFSAHVTHSPSVPPSFFPFAIRIKVRIHCPTFSSSSPPSPSLGILLIISCTLGSLACLSTGRASPLLLVVVASLLLLCTLPWLSHHTDADAAAAAAAAAPPPPPLLLP